MLPSEDAKQHIINAYNLFQIKGTFISSTTSCSTRKMAAMQHALRGWWYLRTFLISSRLASAVTPRMS